MSIYFYPFSLPNTPVFSFNILIQFVSRDKGHYTCESRDEFDESIMKIMHVIDFQRSSFTTYWYIIYAKHRISSETIFETSVADPHPVFLGHPDPDPDRILYKKNHVIKIISWYKIV